MQANCLYTRPTVITTGMAAGSLEAFATYLHALADSYSHKDCIDALDALGMPWGTHTLTDTQVPACYYKPNTPGNDDVHGREFGGHPDAGRTDAAIQHVYAELTARSLQSEGQSYPLSMETELSGTQTLSDLLHIFVHGWDWQHAGERRSLLDRLLPRLQAQRAPIQHGYVPLVLAE
jgi:hypothetical protein